MVHCKPLPLLSTLLFLLSLSGPLYCGATEYYVKPTEGTPCPEPCHTLTEYAQNASQYFTSTVNVTVLFLPGVHHLNQTLSVTNASNMSFQAHPTAIAGGSNVTILCNSGSFGFIDTSNLTIEHLIFSQCSILLYPIMEGHVLISGCEITGRGTALWVDGKNIFPVTIVDSIFANNQAINNGQIINIMTSVTFVNTTFEDNVSINPSTLTAIVSLSGVNNTRFVNCSFHRNTGTPIYTFNSNFSVSGNTRFVNNTGQQGGAMTFHKESQVIIDSNIRTHILFQNNFAVVGGAIFVDNVVDDNYVRSPPHCFFTFTSNDTITSVSLDFINNTAKYGGNAIYGAMLDFCQYQYYYPYADQVISNISYFEPSEDLSKITSPPSRVCLCDGNGKPDCASSIQSIYPSPKYHYPGEMFTIPAALVGDEFGTVSGSVNAQFLLLNKIRTAPQFGTLQQTQLAGHNSCTDLKYTVLSENRSEVIVLTASGAVVDDFGNEGFVNLLIDVFNENGIVFPPLLLLPVYLNITLLSCPLGFTLASPPGECVCNKRMKENNITCNITDQTLHRSGITWISASSDGVVIATNCPFHYCKPGEVAVNLSSPDSQCEFNHSGTLCGGCQPGLSLALGSSQCLPCSNKYLALLIAFITAGIALVFFIKIFNLTVSKGTINGLIFYANIVGAIPTTFFPAGDTNLLTVFIAWLNLDLGIQTCFFDGLNAYWKTWLQFVFPAYIWAIIGLIILLSRLSELVTKIFGSNSADVLATLLLLSYAKLFRTIVAALSFSFLELPDGTRTAVWSPDGNIPYLSGKHIPLFFVALAVLLLLWLPFTAVLLFWQLLQRLTHYRIVRWIVTKRRPFFVTYFGPLKGKHRYWVGVLLLVRGILLVIFAVVPSDSTGVNLLSVSIIAIVLLTYVANLPQSQQQGEGRRALAAGQNLSLSQKVHDYLGIFSGCYNSWYLSLLENSFILNLGVLSVATLYVYSSGGNQAAVVYTSVGIAFAQFLGIICLHVFLSLRKWWKNRRERVDGELQDPNRAEYERIDNEPVPVRDGPLLRVDFSQYREPVLEHFD